MTDFNRQSFKNVFLKENAKKKEEGVVFIEKPASTVYSSLIATPFGKFRNIRLIVPNTDFLLQSAAAFTLKYTQVTKMKRDKA